ncbi:hypothetical protein GWK47_016412 [Chionoecetes opilio]|uniref:Uncharacterized protein n=1 Tax=Chionoecetes opilio TaxID=41210 RepID=A0A8J4XUK9_CHIOP|nr:hypothetical protein GWK47_016412 [Chionoecetes opilio]
MDTTERYKTVDVQRNAGNVACKPLHNTMLDSSPLEQEELQKCPSKLAPHPSLGRHVKFQSAKTSMQDPLVQIDSKECGNNQNHQHCDQQSLEVLKKLAGLRWSLMGWGDVSSAPPTDTSSSLTFLHHLLTSLQTLQWEKKHLKEELTTTLKKLKDLSEDSNTKQHMYEKRETRLVEADRQLGELQQSWASAQEVGQQKVAKFRDRCNVLKQENACLRKESQCLRSEVVELTARTQEHNLIKTQMLETEELLAASKKNTAEVLEENNRVNLCLEENMKHLQELEQGRVPRLVAEVEEWKTRCGGLQDANTQLCGAKVIQGEDFHMLQEQHKILLKKIVEEQEQKAEAEQRKTLLEDEVKGWSGKVAAMKTQLHLHYQAQVEELVVRKSTALQDQLKSLESNLQKTFEERLSAQARSHHATCDRLQKRFEEKIKSINVSYDRQQEAVHSEMKALEDENQRLQQQKQGVITAVSSILGLDHRTGVDPSACVSVAGRGSSRQAGAASLSVDAVNDATAKTAHTPTWDKNVGNLPHLSVHSSSSSDTESTLFHEGSQTVRHLGEHSHGTLQRDMSLNGYQNGQKKDFVVSTDNDKHPKVGAYGECQSLYGKDNSQTQVASCYLHSGTENCSGSEDGCPNRYHSCKNLKRFDHKESLYPSFTTKIRRASEILQASDLTDEDACYQDGDDVTFTPREDDEIARILNELKMQVSQSTQGAPSEAPTHDTSLDRDPASLTLHRLSQVSSVLSQYVAHS